MARRRKEGVVTSQSFDDDNLRDETDEERKEREEQEHREAEDKNKEVQTSDEKLVDQRQRNLYGKLDGRDQ